MSLKKNGMKGVVVAASLCACVVGCCDRSMQKNAGGTVPEETSPAVRQAKASSFGWNAEDATDILQKALDSGVRKLVIDRQAGDWITRPLFITNSNIEVVLADGVTIRAKRGAFHGRNECLIRITGGAKNVTLENLKVHDHNRQGMSPINATGLTVRRCDSAPFHRTRGRDSWKGRRSLA